MQKNIFLLLTLLQMPLAFADETAPKESTPPDTIAKLIERIDQLESRIRNLERQASTPQPVVVVPQYQPYNSPQNQPYMTNPNYPPAPQLPSAPPPYVPYVNPAVPYQQPYQPNTNVPDSWKPFNFNGIRYYIIPVDEAERMNRSQGGDRTKH